MGEDRFVGWRRYEIYFIWIIEFRLKVEMNRLCGEIEFCVRWRV